MVHHHGKVSLEDLLDKLIAGSVDQLDYVTMETVSVFLQETCKRSSTSPIRFLVASEGQLHVMIQTKKLRS